MQRVARPWGRPVRSPGTAAELRATALRTMLTAASWSLARVFALVVLMCGAGLASGWVHAAPAPGAQISNQASASFLDGSGTLKTTSSNVVVLTVAQVASYVLAADINRAAAPGSTVYFAHTLVNTGNGADRFALTLSRPASSLTLGTLAIYADANGDGLPDNTVPISSTGLLAPGERFQFVVAALVPSSAAAGSTGRLRVDATSGFDSAVTGTGTSQAGASANDSVQVSAGAVINVSKQLSSTSGPAPAGPLLVTLRYVNSGSATANNLVLSDALPAGMRYVPGSARWSATGTAPLSDAINAPDDEGAAPNTVAYDFGVSSAGAVTATIRQVPAGSVGTLSFQVQIAAGVQPGAVDNTAQFRYADGPATVGPFATNTASYLVAAASGGGWVGATANQAVSGTPLLLTNVLTNNGNVTDTFDISLAGSTFPAGTVLQLLAADGVTQLVDTDGNGIVDSGPLAPGASRSIVLRLVTPPGTQGGPFSVQKVARSRLDPSQSAIVTDTLVRLVTSSPALLSIDKTASVASVEPGDVFSWAFVIRSNGGADARASTSVVIDGAPGLRIILRDPVPPNTQVVALGAAPAGATALYHINGTPTHQYKSVPPLDLSVVDAVALAYSTALAPGYVANWSFSTKVQANAAASSTGRISNEAQALFNDSTQNVALTVPSNTSAVSITPAPVQLRNYTDPDFRFPTDYTRLGNDLNLRLDAAACNADPAVVETRLAIITGPGGESETFNAVETGPNTGTFTISRVPTRDANPVAGNGLLESHNRDQLTVEIRGCGTAVQANITLIDPAGVVFDSRTNQPVSGAVVSLVTAVGGTCTRTPATVQSVVAGVLGSAPSTVTTGADGRYDFPLVPAGSYCLQVQTPFGWTFASRLQSSALPAGRTIVATGPTAGGSYGGAFPVTNATGPVIVDLPVDSRSGPTLLLEKAASRRVVELGEFVDYTLKLKNVAGAAIPGVTITDDLPAGFAYVPRSARLDGAALADPRATTGGRLTFTLGAVPVDAQLNVTYRVRVGPGALQGDGINRALASTGAFQSNQASAKVLVQAGVFTERGIIIGKVFVDCNRNRLHDVSEVGIPGVRLLLEDGTQVVTDGEGRFNIYGLLPRLHVLKLDRTTLPSGAQLVPLSVRHGGDAGSRFVDLKAGELHRADFAEGSCSLTVMDEVTRRRLLAAEGASQAVRALGTEPLEADARARAPADTRAQPASGIKGVVTDGASAGHLGAALGFSVGSLPAPLSSGAVLPGAPGPSSALVAPIPAPLGRGAEALAPAAASSAAAVAAPAELETLLDQLDPSVGFIGLVDGDLLPTTQSTVRVKGRVGTRLTLHVNGIALPESRVGKKSVLASKGVQAWEYIGVDFKPGTNRLELREVDPFGIERGRQTISLRAPDRLGRVSVAVLRTAPADGHSLAQIEVRLTDSAGLPVTARTPVTLEATVGAWLAVDLDPMQPGTQVFVEGGRAVYELAAPAEPGSGWVRASAGSLQGAVNGQTTVNFLPDLRPLVAAGLIEGVVNLRRLDSRALVPARAQDGFERELMQWSRSAGAGTLDAGARTAFFLKGKVKGDYLLTAAFDSDKPTRERLFRDIQPDEYYPVYGDSAQRGFDAQSTGRLYVRVDKDKSYLLYGDFITQGGNETLEARKLGHYSRSFTGLKQHYESGGVTLNAFASHDRTRQVIDELLANGTSGPFALSAAGVLENSEKVELLTRDRSQGAIVLKTVALTRFVDYEIETLTGRLLLRTPAASLDANLNPQSLRVTYEVEQGGTRFWVAGVDGQVKLGDTVEVGGVWVSDRNPVDPATLVGAHLSWRLAARTVLMGELAQTRKPLTAGTGAGQRVEIKHEDERWQANAYAGHTDTAFDNPGAALSRGRTEAGARALYRADERTTVRVEALRTAADGHQRSGVMASGERRLGEDYKLELGLRHARESVGAGAGAAAAPVTTGSSTGSTPGSLPAPTTPQADISSLRARLTGPMPGVTGATLYGEVEQDVRSADRRVAALGGDYALADKGKVYLRHEFISSLSGPYALNGAQKQNATVMGLDTDYLPGSHLFTEYRVRDAYSGGDAQAAIGLRNAWVVSPGVKLGSSFERVHTLSGRGTEEATAGALSIDITTDPDWKGSARLELRRASSEDSLLNTLGWAYKLDQEWTALLRNAYALSRHKSAAGGRRLQERAQFGLAYRDTQTNAWHVLSRYEHRIDQDSTQPLVPLRQSSDVVSLAVNHQASAPLVISGRLAAKWLLDESNGINSRSATQLLSLRAIYALSERWDAGAVGSVMRGTGGRSRHTGLGVEGGYRVAPNLWLSAGFNFFGFKDRDLAGSDSTQRGAFIRLRFKFDEDWFVFDAPGASTTSAAAARSAGSAP